ncbi:MAG: hypothetical protein HY748_17405 [Elusimicrobia bacterium]|nr:hypothetical protein [Elusimicrobiota bacterium]
MVLQKAKAQVEYWWRVAKLVMGAMMVWGLVFSLVTIAKLGVAFDYDDTLVFSTPAYEKAYAASPRAVGPRFWSIVNQSYDLERPKIVPLALAWALRVLGFRVTIIASRPDTDGAALQKEWRRLAPKSRFLFAGEGGSKRRFLEGGNLVLFFGDSDTDISEARKADVFPVRVKRSSRSSYQDDYRPGTMREIVLPLSQY